MENVNKQQEFLENLKNPTKARIKEAVKHFQQNHGKSIREIRITQNINHVQGCENQFAIDVIADNHGILLVTSRIFCNKLERFMNNSIISRHEWIEEDFDGTYRITYYVTEV